MAMERQDYPAMLPQLQPSQAVDVLTDRVRQVGKLNIAIADWLAARRQLEDQYADGLRRLAQRQLDAGELGVFTVPWTTMARAADTMADAHTNLATRIQVEVERPLRDFTSQNREMIHMGNMQGNLSALARDVERAQQKIDKLRGKGGGAESNKIANATTELESAQAQWDSQAPYVFESLQAADETRINHLRDLLTQFQTMETDQLEKSRQTAEQSLNVLLNVQTEDEIKTFVLKSTQARPSLARTQRSSTTTPSRGATMAAPSNLTPTVSRPEDEGRSLRSGQDGTPDEKSKSRFGGLKRIGTVISKRRESRIPPGLPSTSESPERKVKSSPFGRLGRSKDSSSNLAPVDEGLPNRRPSSPLRLGSEIFQSPSEREIDPMESAPGTSSSHVNGASAAAAGLGVAGSLAAAGFAFSRENHQTELADLDPPKPDQPGSQPIPEPRQDSEGFSVPPQDRDPITQAQQEAGIAPEYSAPQYNVNIRDTPIREDGTNDDAALASMANTLAPPTTARRANTVRGRRGDRTSSALNSVFIPSEQQLSEMSLDMSDDITPAPVTGPTTTLPTEPNVTASGGAIPPAGAIAAVSGAVGAVGAGGVAASAFSSFSPQAEALPSSSSPFRPDSRTNNTTDFARGDTQSIRSATTSGSLGGSKHPELAGTGLLSSIIETIGARFESGKLSSSTMIGEIALAYNPADFSTPFTTENIRLDNFGNLEKVAPNPAFINQIPNKEGEYTVNLSSITKAQVAFKYQVRLDDEQSQAPLLLVPAFKIEPSQSSVIVSYSLNPKFSIGTRTSITFSNVTIALTLEGARATGCLSKPVGIFSKEKNLIYWQLNDITLTPGGSPDKLLARFTTDAEAKSGSVESKWEITGESAQGLGSGLSVSTPNHSGGDGADPFADESMSPSGGWRVASGAKKLVSGMYVAK